jgi:Septum formation
MARSTTIRLPGTDGPDIVIERGTFSKPRVTIDGSEVPRDPSRKDSFSIVTANGATRSFALKSDRNGLKVVADDGSHIALDPPRPPWETVLAFLPVGLVAVGGLVGGAIGGAAAAGNIAISRSDLRTPVRVAAMLAVTVVAALGWFAIARTVANALSPIPTYVTGQCVDGLGTGDSVDPAAIRTAACAEPHRGEVVGIHAISASSDGSAFPGLSTIESTAMDRCPPLFAEYVGIGYDASRLEMIYIYPSSDTWNRGDRQIACIATGPSGEKLTGSIAGTAR